MSFQKYIKGRQKIHHLIFNIILKRGSVSLEREIRKEQLCSVINYFGKKKVPPPQVGE
jgi:hypothetical protein